ncbi:MAG: DUF2029 domain-containing protein [Planctomycetes bacterium]|nr:DUF2029 domain-containing protein [Planctomycetota bacterium]
MPHNQLSERASRLSRPWGPILVWGIAIIVISTLVWLKPHSRTVYSIYANAGKNWIEGRDAYIIPAGTGLPDNYRYSPLNSVGFTAFSYIPDRIGAVLWRWLGAALVLVGFGYACRTLDPTWKEKTDHQRQWLWLFLLPFCVANLYNGQANLHVCGLLLLGVAAAQDKRWSLSAVCLTLACLVKVYPVALVMLIIAMYPLRLGPRFALAMAVGLTLPFLAQSFQYVLDEYRTWIKVMAGDDRFSVEHGTKYRDFSLLLFRAGVPIDRAKFFILQAGSGIAAAIVCLNVRWRLGWSSQRSIWLGYCLGTFWMLLFGPATESSTYVLIAPVAAWLVMDALRGRFSPVATCFIICGGGLVHVGLFSSWFPFYRIVHAFGVHPLGALMMTIGYLFAEFGNRNENISRAKEIVPTDDIAKLRLSA